MFAFHRYPLPTDDSAFARSALPTAPQLADTASPESRPSHVARLTAAALVRLARLEVRLAHRFDPSATRRAGAVPAA